MNNGNVLIISTIFIAIFILIILFISAVFVSHVTSTLYNFKSEMYLSNKAAVVAVNKYDTSIDNFSYNKKVYRDEFEKIIKENYELNSNFENGEKLISKITIKEYEIYKKGDRDSFTGEKLKNRIIHSLIEVKLKPIIMKNFFEKIFTFEIHLDVNLNSVKAGG